MPLGQKPPRKDENGNVYHSYVDYSSFQLGLQKNTETPKKRKIKKRTWGIIMACLLFIFLTLFCISMVGVPKTLITYGIVSTLFSTVVFIVNLIMSED